MEASQREAAELADQMAGDIEALQAQVGSLQARVEAAEAEADEVRAELTAPSSARARRGAGGRDREACRRCQDGTRARA